MHEVIKIKTDEASLQKTITGFLSLVEEIPWGNSDFQNHQTIVNMELTPERAYRHASLRIMNRLQALNECYFNLRKEEIQIERLKRKGEVGDDLDKHEAAIEIEQIESRRPYTEKLIKDAIAEVESLAPVIEAIGKLTRKTFEAAEHEHFRQRYLSANKPEALRALEAMGEKPGTSPLFEQITVKQLLEKKEGG